jgi:elongation factor Ts
MADFSAADIKNLREKTGAGMMDCKTALAENGGDFEASVDWLRQKGIAKAGKKAGRVAAEGLVAIAQTDTGAGIIELNSETDFVAKNDTFQTLANTIAGYAAATKGDLDALNKHQCATFNKPVADVVTEHIATIGENLTLRRSAFIAKPANGTVVSYIHNPASATTGKIGVLVGLESEGDAAKLQELGKQLAMHVAAAKPEALTQEGVSDDLVERERNIFAEQARASGKPEAIIEKMIEGRIRKFYEEIVLLDQAFVIDGKTKISEVLEEAAKDLGAPVKITSYVRFELGEGVEKKEGNFAEEVAAAVNG